MGIGVGTVPPEGKVGTDHFQLTTFPLGPQDGSSPSSPWPTSQPEMVCLHGSVFNENSFKLVWTINSYAKADGLTLDRVCVNINLSLSCPCRESVLYIPPCPESHPKFTHPFSNQVTPMLTLVGTPRSVSVSPPETESVHVRRRKRALT